MGAWAGQYSVDWRKRVTSFLDQLLALWRMQPTINLTGRVLPGRTHQRSNGYIPEGISNDTRGFGTRRTPVSNRDR